MGITAVVLRVHFRTIRALDGSAAGLQLLTVGGLDTTALVDRTSSISVDLGEEDHSQNQSDLHFDY